MMKAHARGFFRRHYEVYEDDRFLASLDTSGWRESAGLELHGKQFRFIRDGIGGPFLLLEAENVIAFAEKPSAFRDRFVVSFGPKNYELKSASFWSWELELNENEGTVGYVRPRGFFRREFEADLPLELPSVVRTFILWLAILIERRHQAAAAN